MSFFDLPKFPHSRRAYSLSAVCCFLVTVVCANDIISAANTDEVICHGKGCYNTIFHRNKEPKSFWFEVTEDALFGALTFAGGVFFCLAVVRFKNPSLKQKPETVGDKPPDESTRS